MSAEVVPSTLIIRVESVKLKIHERIEGGKREREPSLGGGELLSKRITYLVNYWCNG